MKVRISPAAPTIEPAMINTLLPITKPVNAAAIPDSEFSRLTTTGISAPPIGNTNRIPSKVDVATNEYTHVLFSGSCMVIAMSAMDDSSNRTLT